MRDIERPAYLIAAAALAFVLGAGGLAVLLLRAA